MLNNVVFSSTKHAQDTADIQYNIYKHVANKLGSTFVSDSCLLNI